MATDVIDVEVVFKGTEEAASGSARLAAAIEALAAKVGALSAPVSQAEEKLKKVKSAEDQAAEAAKKLAAEQNAAATKAIAFSQKISSTANAVQALTSQLGGQSRTAGLIGATIASGSQFAQLGAALGPQGALVGAIVGAAVPALVQMANAENEAAEAAVAHREAVDSLVVAMRTQAQQAGNADAVRRAASSGSTSERTSALSQFSDEQLDAERQRAIADRQTILRSGGDASSSSDTRDQVRQLGLLRQTIDTLEQETRRRDEVAAAATRQAEATAAAAVVRQEAATRGAAAEAQWLSNLEDLASYTDAQRARATAYAELQATLDQEREERERAGLEAVREAFEAQKARDDERGQWNYEQHQAWLQEQAEKMDAIREQMALEDQAALDRMQQAQENDDLLEELNRDAAERGRARVEEYQSVTGVIVGGLTEALVAIVSGQKSAEEAFKGLLASFLTFISEQSALKAASEFAFAIADFASQNYSGGVQHLAAGVAFTAVAVAAGAGGAALSAPSAAAAGPQEGASSKDRDSGGGGGGNVTVNYNAPVIGTSQEAESGRMIRGLIRAADDRFGA